MKVQELRNLLSASEREHVEKAFVESYKQLRKMQKEEIDPILIDILKGKAAEKKKTAANLSFEDLEQQITVFLENAYAQNYLAPNRIIPKNQRPKWRFLVKNFIKELEKIPRNTAIIQKPLNYCPTYIICSVKPATIIYFPPTTPFALSVGSSHTNYQTKEITLYCALDLVRQMEAQD